MLDDALAALGAADADQRFAYWASDAAEVGVTPGAFEPRRQVSGNLGVRLVAAFSELLRGPDDQVAIFGADSPALTAPNLEAALRAIESADLALAPSRDGGFTIIALRRPFPELFVGIPWGSAKVFESTRDRARLLGLSLAVLERLDDVDTPDDLCRLIAWAITGGASRAPATVAALRELGLLPERSRT
jgi:glycosyltransferase A (GT-A) superfamily protein (DUF2064 family)